jgi:glycine betaine/proline transport system substrate-binding protein
MRLTRLAAVAGVLLALAPAASRAADPAECRTVRLADIGWADVSATTALAGLILKDLGYTPKPTELSVAATYQALKAKDVDVFLGNWMPSMEPDRKSYVADKSIDVLGPNLEGTKFTLAVPQYTWDKGLHDFADIQKFGKDLGFKIYGIEPGNDGNQHIQDLIRDPKLGLDKFQLVDGSEQAMLSQVEKAYRARKPIVFLGWQPHPMNRSMKIAYLTGGDATFGPDFGAENVYTNVRTGYVAACPNVGKLLENLKFDLGAEDTMMDSILNRNMDPTRAAASWLRGHKSVLKAWLDGVTTIDGRPGEAVVAGRL